MPPLHTSHPHTQAAITANLSGPAWVISPRFGESLSFDHAGRLLSLFADGRSYQRTLDHRLLERLKNGESARRRELPPAERDSVLRRAFETLAGLSDILPDLDLSPGERDQLAGALAVIRSFGPERLAADGERFQALYQPVSILPPDQYLALVLQATEGCSWNRCTFCGLYRDRPFRIHDPASFRDHCAQVRDFFGEGLSLRRGIFLADANALIIPFKRLRALMEIAQAEFGPRPVYSFVSAFHVGLKTGAQWADLHGLGLERAYIGLETGDDDLLRFLNKPGRAQDAVDAVCALRAGGVSVGVIVMAGIGGDRFAAAHVERSVAAIRAMDLGPADQVYISDYVAVPGSEYEAQAAEAGIRPLNHAEIVGQRRIIQDQVRALGGESDRESDRKPGPIVAPYFVDGFAL